MGLVVDRQQALTGVLCAVAAVAASAVVAVLVPPPEAQPGARPAAAHGSPSPKAAQDGSASRPQLNGSPSAAAPGASPAPAPTPSGPPSTTTGPAFTGVLFEGKAEGGHFCTATVVHSPGRNLLVTAGHCLAKGPSGLQGALFAPAYAAGAAPYGTWRIEEVYEDDRWADGADDDYDLAFARVAPNAAGIDVEAAVGAAELDTRGRSDEEVTVTGYPTGRETPRTCTTRAVRTSATEQRIDCADFPDGTSGSAWLARDGRIIGVLTGGDTDDVSTSTVLDGYAAELYRRAQQDAAARQ
ncbi:trypsin-like serine peptidase [Streptomyces antimicrobicus]|uniref:Trypsin-like peptidase domain-containing protein n=1 Tax=Streptomyces antimicrobicus TaxID=2883108 RepID=A0ABS8B4Z3_9ACTN|nr:trypsin-like peptidase domain-containing protein [Streptomyces antimicrobicus]MCB5179685.1 trypsin-like peptidase domain-containing protein [Streptomyces antimicrobicus]